MSRGVLQRLDDISGPSSRQKRGKYRSSLTVWHAHAVKATPIDNIYFKLSPLVNNAEAGILYTKISDHFPHFFGLKLSDWYCDQKTRLVKKRINTK